MLGSTLVTDLESVSADPELVRGLSLLHGASMAAEDVPRLELCILCGACRELAPSRIFSNL